MNKLHTPDQFRTKNSLIGMGVVGLVLAYLLVTRAFDTGNLWQYAGTALLLILSTHLFIRAAKTKKS